jgi:pilus assembly protein Flp/PilA
MIRRFLKDNSAATVVEYGLIVAVLSLAIVAGIGTATNSVKLVFTNTADKLDSSVD